MMADGRGNGYSEAEQSGGLAWQTGSGWIADKLSSGEY